MRVVKIILRTRKLRRITVCIHDYRPPLRSRHLVTVFGLSGKWRHWSNIA